MKYETVFENSHVLAVDKPSGWLTTPAREADDPRPCLGREVQAAAGLQIFPIHRLDFEVSGLVLFAKTRDAHRDIQKWFEDGASGGIAKTYQALSAPFGDMSEYREWARWKSRIAKGKRRAFEAPHGKDSFTRARVIADENGVWRWELVPQTGRPHQLRFEMAKHGFPILGDVLYGGKAISENWIALRAVGLDMAAIPEAKRFGLPAALSVAPVELPR